MMEKFNDSEEKIKSSTETVENKPEIMNEIPFIPLINFKTKLKEETHRKEEIMIYGEKMMESVLREDHKELSEGFYALFEKSKDIFKEYWKTEISSKGNKHETEVPIAGYPDRIRRYIQGENSGITYENMGRDIETKERFYKSLSETFELYSCIKHLKPDAIVVLVNGASRLGAICEAMGFKTNKLSIHKNAGAKVEKQNDYRRELSDEINYDGDEIIPGSRVLLLEDTSELMEERTYRDAREWLAERGVIDTPVFIERISAFSGEYYHRASVDQLVEIQKQLDEDNCFLSLTTWHPQKDSDYWKKVKGRLTKIIENTPELYAEFFSLIRKLGQENNSNLKS